MRLAYSRRRRRMADDRKRALELATKRINEKWPVDGTSNPTVDEVKEIIRQAIAEVLDGEA